ncbi:MAG: radical SAM protein [Candidatus Pacearchaeota archaeon]|jgi:radical SAM superfamily enzyme YgiQ (UPF0313 family)
MAIKPKKILFVYLGIENESLGIEYLSAVLKKHGHKTDLILEYPEEKNFKDRLYKRINEFNPDFIGFSVVTDDYSWASKTAKIIKEEYSIPIIFGGIHVTSCPEEVISNNFVDYIVRGEGDAALLEIINNPKNTKIKNMWTKKGGKIIKNPIRPLVTDLDSLPFPDRMLFHKEAPYLSDVYHCMTSRGCPFHCTYCFNNFMKKLYKDKGSWLRRRSVENVIEELKIMNKNLNYKQILFVDDSFTSNAKWLKEFLKRYKKEINVPFKIIAHPLLINEEIVSLLKKGGCIRIQLGVQTPIEKIRKEICKRHDSNKAIEKAIKIIHKYKIMVQIDHIFGLPSEKVKDYEKGIEFYIRLKPSFISSFFLQYYPNTEIINVGKEYGLVTDEEISETIKGNVSYMDMVHRRISNKDILAISKFFCWIPILPRNLSRFILRKKLYLKIFKNNKLDKINKIPYMLQHLFSIELIKTAILSRKRKKDMKDYRKIVFNKNNS